MAAAPMMGAWRGVVRGLRPFMIHGDAYVEMAIELPGGELEAVRVAGHVVSGVLAVGAAVEVKFLLGQVTGVVVLGGSGAGG